MSIEIQHEAHEDGGRYHLVVDGKEAGELDYRMDGDVRVYVHTGVHAGRLPPHGTTPEIDQLAMDRPRKVQSTFVQSPLPLKIMGMARCRGKVSIMP